nr:MAG TPA: hypothetical protein [Caudoviricetes sp.]
MFNVSVVIPFPFLKFCIVASLRIFSFLILEDVKP